jgi:ankyrin repeat protein
MIKKVNLGLTSLNTTGATPYFLAAKTADAELMRLFASLGADTSITNVDGATPLMAAAGLGTRSPGEDAGTEPEVLEALQAALDLGADINAVDKNGETAMHSAAYKNHPQAIEFLAAHGAKIETWNRENKRGWTPLTIAEGYRFGNYKPSPETVAAIHRVMKASGVPIPPPYNPAKKVNSDYK